MMKNLWLAAALAVSFALGGLSLPQAEAGDGHHGHHGHHGGHGDCYYGGPTLGYGGYPSYGYGSRYGVYGPSRAVVGRVYSGSPYYYGGYSPYYGGLGTGVGIGIYSSGYRGLGYSNFGVGPSLRFGSPYGAPFGVPYGLRF